MYRIFKQNGLTVSIVLSALVFVLSGPAFCGQQDTLAEELRTLVDEENETFLLTEIQRIEPYYAIRQLVQYQQMQNRVGGGSCGCAPDQFLDVYEIPLPVDEIGVLQAAIFLATQRKSNLEALERLGLPMTFPPMPLAGAPQTDSFSNMTLHTDWSVLTAFLDALSDGEVTMDEAILIAQMPANHELLQFIRAQHEGLGPCVTEETLPCFIWRAGSSNPLDRLWRWLNPMNDFGYAELAVNTIGYGQLVAGLGVHHQNIENAALARIAPFLPPDLEMDATFALTVGCPNSDWATPVMSGASASLLKSGWEDLVQGISAGVYRQQLIKHWHNPDGNTPQTLDDLVFAGLDDQRYEIFHELIAYSILEGSIDFVSTPMAPINEKTDFMEGARLIDHFVVEILQESHVESARDIFDRGRGLGGSLRALGRHMAEVIASRDGSLAVTNLLEQGVMRFLQRAIEIESDKGEVLFSEETLSAISDLSVQFKR